MGSWFPNPGSNKLNPALVVQGFNSRPPGIPSVITMISTLSALGKPRVVGLVQINPPQIDNLLHEGAVMCACLQRLLYAKTQTREKMCS